MAKLILMSFIIAMIAIPARAARNPNPQKGLRATITQILIFYVWYAFALIFLWSRC